MSTVIKKKEILKIHCNIKDILYLLRRIFNISQYFIIIVLTSCENKIDLPFPTTSEFKLGKKVEEEKEEEEDKNSDTSRNKTDINRQGSSSPKRISSSPVSPFLYFSAVGLKAARVLAACTSHGPFLSIRTIYSRNNCVMQKNAVRGGSRRRIALKHVARASVEQPPSSASFLPSTPPLPSPLLSSRDNEPRTSFQREFPRKLRWFPPAFNLTICFVR